MSLTSQSLPIPRTREETQVPSAPSSSLCPENAEGQRSRVRVASLALEPTTRKPWCKSNRVPLCQATLSIGLYLLLEGPNPTRVFYPPRRRINNRIRTLTCLY